MLTDGQGVDLPRGHPLLPGEAGQPSQKVQVTSPPPFISLLLKKIATIKSMMKM